MAHVRSKVQCKNALIAKLESGTAKVGGMRLLLPVDDRMLVPVEVIGIAFGSGYRGGMLIKVKPIGGAGEIPVDAVDLVDDTPKGRDEYARKSEAKDAFDDFRRTDTDRKRRDWILRRREKLTAAQRKAFDATAEDHFGKETDMVKGIGKAQGEYDLRRIAERLIRIAFNLDGEAEVDD